MSDRLKPRNYYTELLVDIIGILLVPTGLTAIHFLLSPRLRVRFALDHAQPTLLTMWTSAFVHTGVVHLLNDIIGYLVAILPAWFLAVQQRQRTSFWISFLIVLVGFPIPLSLATDLSFQYWFPILSTSISLGFSGLVGGYTGLLFGFLTSFFASRYNTQTALIGTVIVLLSLLGVLIEFLPLQGILWLKATLLASIVFGIGFLAIKSRQTQVKELGLKRLVRVHAPQLGIVGSCWIVLAALTVFLFPAQASTSSITNVIAHGLGIVGGYGSILTVQTGLSHWTADGLTENAQESATQIQPTTTSSSSRFLEQTSPQRVTLESTYSIKLQRLPSRLLPVKRDFVRPVVEHQVQITYQTQTDPLDLRFTAEPEKMMDADSRTGAIRLRSTDGETQSVTMTLAKTYLTSTFFPRRHILNQTIEQKVSNTREFQFDSAPNGTVAPRPPGQLDRSAAQTYTWLQPSSEGTEHPTERGERYWSRLPQGEYSITVAPDHNGQNHVTIETNHLQPHLTIPETGCTLATTGNWSQSWQRYQSLRDTLQHILGRQQKLNSDEPTTAGQSSADTSLDTSLSQ